MPIKFLLSIKYQRNCHYQVFILTILTIEILQELKGKDELHKINGILVIYSSTKRMVEDCIILRLNRTEFEHEVKKALIKLGNSNIEPLIEFQITAFRYLGSNQYCTE
jgi:hypothetical protein